MYPIISLTTDDPQALSAFYAGLHARFVFKWDDETVRPWRCMLVGIELTDAACGVPPALRGRLVFPVDDMAASIAHVLASGGSVLIPASEEDGRVIAMIADPSGNEVGLHCRA